MDSIIKGTPHRQYEVLEAFIQHTRFQIQPSKYPCGDNQDIHMLQRIRFKEMNTTKLHNRKVSYKLQNLKNHLEWIALKIENN